MVGMTVSPLHPYRFIYAFVSVQFAIQAFYSLSGPELPHMAPPGEITDTQIGVATWMFLWCTVLGSVGSVALMGLYQHADWWNLIPYIGTRTSSLSHAYMRPVRKRKNPQIALRNREMRQQMSDGKAAERNPTKMDNRTPTRMSQIWMRWRL